MAGIGMHWLSLSEPEMDLRFSGGRTFRALELFAGRGAIEARATGGGHLRLGWAVAAAKALQGHQRGGAVEASGAGPRIAGRPCQEAPGPVEAGLVAERALTTGQGLGRAEIALRTAADLEMALRRIISKAPGCSP